MELFYLLGGLAVSGLIGGLIGNGKERGMEGLIWGLLLGPMGWVIVLARSDSRRKCPACGGALGEGKVSRCKNCGSVLGRLSVLPGELQSSCGKPDPMLDWEAREQAKTVLPVPEHLRGKHLEE